MIAVEYAIDALTYIRRSPHFDTQDDHRVWWWIGSPLYKHDDPVRYEAGFRTRYWSKVRGWWHCCPTQFDTPEEALAAYQEWQSRGKTNGN